jgi:para-nitrobenzyl esterase
MIFKRYVLISMSVYFFLIISGCGSNGPSQSPIEETKPQPNPPAAITAEVYKLANFSVELTTDVKYGEGLSHAYWNTESSDSKSLLLDIYEPNNEESLKPAVVFIHGGGFVGGDKSMAAAFDTLTYFAERGFIGISINYRLLRDYGTLPDTLLNAIDAIPNLSESSRDQVKAMYPAIRDAKGAIRWVYQQADALGIDTDHVSVVGGSAGSIIGVALGVINPEDYTNELTTSEDPTLITVNLDRPAVVHTVINHWGSAGGVNLLEQLDGVSRWDESDAPLSIVHGTVDTTVAFSNAQELRSIYSSTGAPFAYYPLEGFGHGAWSATVGGKTLNELAFDFIVGSQGLSVID